MICRRVLFGEDTVSQGRNGSVITTGVEVLAVEGFPPKLSPITSRGAAANCFIELDRAALPELIRVLQAVVADTPANPTRETPP